MQYKNKRPICECVVWDVVTMVQLGLDLDQ